ncbi:hypothetical protein BLS_005565 [Venturia inaequalis]|uniref:F-box domain-containing protein n=2 Tax=Venturia inaequalis TaxID=5025 RepID=A0A8H3UE89_VENIN|nr:hypothetical protein BLS_005565 [Venturia inaequalis]
MANGGRMTMSEATGVISSSPRSIAQNFLSMPFDIINQIYKLVAEETPSICQYSTGMTPRECRTLHALSLVNKQIRSEFNKILVKVNGPAIKYRENVNVWAYYQYSMRIRTIEQYDQISGHLHDGNIITNKPYVLDVDIGWEADYNCIRHILLRLRNDFSNHSKLIGVSIKFEVFGMKPNWEYAPGLIEGHWNFSRKENGAWKGSFWKETRDSQWTPPLELPTVMSTEDAAMSYLEASTADTVTHENSAIMPKKGATQSQHDIFNFPGLPAELRLKIYGYIAAGTFFRRRHQNLPPETMSEFQKSYPILFLNKQTKAEFLVDTQTLNPGSGALPADRLNPAITPVEYYTYLDKNIHEHNEIICPNEMVSDSLENPYLYNIGRIEIFINTDGMDTERVGFFLWDINTAWHSRMQRLYPHPTGVSCTCHDFDEMNITYAKVEDRVVGIQHAKYNIVLDRDSGIWRTTLVRMVRDEDGDIEEIKEVKEAYSWKLDQYLPENERERVLQKAREKKLRAEKDDK